MNFNQDLKNILILYPDINVSSSEDYKTLINIHNIIKSASGKSPEAVLVEKIFLDKDNYSLVTANDFYHYIFKSSIKNSEFKKIAYPMYNDTEIKQEFDINKWADLVHKIYKFASDKKVSITDAIDYYAKTLDKDSQEDIKFKEWIKYYHNGEHLKYKKAFQFPLSGPGFYPQENAFFNEETSILNKVDKLKSNQAIDSKSEYSDWKNKLYSAIRRIDKLLRQSEGVIDVESQRDLADLLHRFDQEVRTIKHISTASDVAFKYANKFKKLGFPDAYSELTKYAQAVPEPEQSQLQQPIDEQSQQQKPLEQESPENKSDLGKGKSGDELASTLEKQKDEEVHYDINPDRKYDLSDAAAKAEEIAGRLSNRKEIRLMAELDIILDNIGIASLFPDLLEAQSKMIDGNSYALTRITRILGMLASGKSLSEISTSKKKELVEKTQKEINKVFEPEQSDDEKKSNNLQQAVNEPEKEVAEPKPNPQPTPQPQPKPQV